MKQQALWLRKICLNNSTPLSDDQLTLLEKYVALLVEWNTKINLISRKDVENVWANHILHSISFLFKLQLRDAAKVLDLGTGGGLPGIPLKVMKPSIRLTLLDSTQKKIGAVQDMVRTLGLKNVETIWGRAEELGLKKGFARNFDYVIARAVGPLADLVRFSVPFFSGSGSAQPGQGIRQTRTLVEPPALIAFKGGDMDKEMEQISTLKGVTSTEVIQLVFAGSEEISLTDKKLVVVRF